ncbi:CIS tube protein [Luteibacter yeojuensis]|uniref:Peptidoglycan-binding protein n=1 Tax=Luteibacter yeojuensis TaxID=345309 RepID=A0A7X5QSU1_9GAMM|nr:peptidoglycan-binding protein [Luteibacter yeojuensis]NID14699.1 peptidoglycan-binding protein [Luteibacter yeojuensis]
MAANLSSGKSQLKITVCDISGDAPKATGDSISLLINPSEMTWVRQTEFGGCVPMGDTGSGRNFAKMQPDTLDFVTVFDGTGAVPIPSNIQLPAEVEDQLAKLDTIIHKYNGPQHEPNVVQVLWGTLVFYGRATSISTDYTLFRPSGAPLRAKVTMSFQGFKKPLEAALEADMQSPDLSHAVVVRDGDTLPLLCHRIYGDSRYYVEVARFNGLQTFRALAPGLTLHFPPLD